MKFETLPPISKFFVDKNNTPIDRHHHHGASLLDSSVNDTSRHASKSTAEATDLTQVYTNGPSDFNFSLGDQASSPPHTLTPNDQRIDPDSTISLAMTDHTSSRKLHRLTMGDMINDSPSKENNTMMTMMMAMNPSTHGGLPSSPLSKLSKTVANSSTGAMSNYTYDFTTAATSSREKHHSSQNETTVVPFDMELRPQVTKKFDGGSSAFNSSFAEKTKSFPMAHGLTIPAIDSIHPSSPMNNQQLLLSDDLILSKFDTNFPEPKQFQDLFAFDESFPSSTPSGQLVVAPSDSNDRSSMESKPQISGKKPPTSASNHILKPNLTATETTSPPTLHPTPLPKPPVTKVTKPAPSKRVSAAIKVSKKSKTSGRKLPGSRTQSIATPKPLSSSNTHGRTPGPKAQVIATPKPLHSSNPHPISRTESIATPKPLSSSVSHVRPPTLPPPAPKAPGPACNVSLPSIRDMLKPELEVKPKDGEGSNAVDKFKSIDINEKMKFIQDYAAHESNHSMRLRNRKPMDYNTVQHISLSQLSGLNSSSSPMGSQSTGGSSIYDPMEASASKTSKDKIKKKKKNPKTEKLNDPTIPSSPLRYYSAFKRPPTEKGTKRPRTLLAARSKSGCWTCRIRKKKCTEEKPLCYQCHNLGLKCDGYAEERPEFMANQASQRRRLDEIKAQTLKNKKVGVKKSSLINSNNIDEIKTEKAHNNTEN